MVETCIKISFASEVSRVKEVLNTILSYLKSEFPYISSYDLFDLRLIYSELLFNAVIHGNKEDLSKEVHLTIQFNQDCILSVIRDEGNGFNYSEVLDNNEALDDFFSESGRGIKIVRSLSDALKFNKKGNEIEFLKRVNCVEYC